MRLRIDPLSFLARLVATLVATYLVWGWIAPIWIRVLARFAQGAVWLTELSPDPAWRGGTTILVKGVNVFYTHRHFAAFRPPLEPQGIAGDWIMANVVLLVALMLATPAATWPAKARRFLVAMIAVLGLQVIDILVAIKLAYAQFFAGYWGAGARKTYQFLDAFFQSYDTLLFPFAIWAGIHLRELLGGLVVPAARHEAPARLPEPGPERSKREEPRPKKRPSGDSRPHA